MILYVVSYQDAERREDPRVNIQNDHGRAKPYQVRQVLAAIEKKGETEK